MVENKNMGKFKSIIEWSEHKLISEDMEKYTQMSMGYKNTKQLYVLYIPEKYRLPMDATKGMSIEELHSICELCFNKYFSAIQNGIENPPLLDSIICYPIGEDLWFYFAMKYMGNKFIRISEVKCSCTHTNNHKIEYELTWTDGATSLLNSEFQFLLRPGQSKPYKCSQCIHVYDFDNRNTHKGIALFGTVEGMYYFNDDIYLIKTNGESLHIPINYEGVIIFLPMPYGILYKDKILLIEDRSVVYVFDIYQGYICYLKDKTLSNLNQEDMARIWFENHPMNYQGPTP